MTEHENTNEVPLSIAAGTLLRNKRESQGMTQKQVADRLRLRVSVVDDIEHNRFGSQVTTFTRGYLRSYAKLLGLDENIVLSALEQTAEVTPKAQDVEMQSFSRKTKHEKHNSRIMALTWIIAIIITGISAIWWWQNQKDNSLNQVATDSNVEAPQPSTEELIDIDNISADDIIATTPAEIEAPVVDEALDVAPESDSDNIAADVTEEPVVSEDVIEEPAVIVPEGMSLLTMKFESDCWIQVQDANGKTLITGTRKPGQNVELTGKAPFKVILGAPEGVTMTFASEPVDLSRYTAGKVARITLPL